MNVKTNVLPDIPCWLPPSEKEIAHELLAIDWYWLPSEEPEYWEDESWEHKIFKVHGWQFWSVPGEVCLMVSKNGAVFGLCLEGTDLNFERELAKAKKAIQRVTHAQRQERPKQLTLFDHD